MQNINQELQNYRTPKFQLPATPEPLNSRTPETGPDTGDQTPRRTGVTTGYTPPEGQPTLIAQ